MSAGPVPRIEPRDDDFTATMERLNAQTTISVDDLARLGEAFATFASNVAAAFSEYVRPLMQAASELHERLVEAGASLGDHQRAVERADQLDEISTEVRREWERALIGERRRRQRSERWTAPPGVRR